MLDLDKLADMLTPEEMAQVRANMDARTKFNRKNWGVKVDKAKDSEALRQLARNLPTPTEADLPPSITARAIASGALTLDTPTEKTPGGLGEGST
jgi:hypothetical protein